MYDYHGYKVVITDAHGKKTTGKGNSAHQAYKDAECKMIVKPWLTSLGT